VKLATGTESRQEPRLFLWGLELKPHGVAPWELLSKARERFESDLPVSRPKTEPDIALFLPGQYLILIEAKFCSPNGIYVRDRTTRLFDLTIEQLVRIYQDRSLQLLDYHAAAARERIHYQLWRNMTFAEWMAVQDTATTKAFHVNLVRHGYEAETCGEFLTLIRPQYHDRFEQIFWEQIYHVASQQRPKLDSLCRYMEEKTERLAAAFEIAASDDGHRANTP
jgi:hypothetical protein